MERYGLSLLILPVPLIVGHEDDAVAAVLAELEDFGAGCLRRRPGPNPTGGSTLKTRRNDSAHPAQKMSILPGKASPQRYEWTTLGMSGMPRSPIRYRRMSAGTVVE